MIQEIITYMIILFAVVYTVYSIVRLFVPRKNSDTFNCNSACCSNKNTVCNSVPIKVKSTSD